MAKLFNGTVLGCAVPTSLAMSLSKNNNVTIEAQFKIEPDQTASDENSKPCEVGGGYVSWFATLSSDKAKARIRESLEYCGLSGEAVDRVMDFAESNSLGKLSQVKDFGFGTQKCDLVCEINEYDGKRNTRVKWINRPGGRPSKRLQDLPELDLGIKIKAKTGTNNNNNNGNGSAQKAPWETA